MTQFDIFLDILENSRIVSLVDFIDETEWIKGVIYFVYEGKRFEVIFNNGNFESFKEVI